MAYYGAAPRTSGRTASFNIPDHFCDAFRNTSVIPSPQPDQMATHLQAITATAPNLPITLPTLGRKCSRAGHASMWWR